MIFYGFDQLGAAAIKSDANAASPKGFSNHDQAGILSHCLLAAATKK